MDTILSVDHKARVCATRLVRVNDFIDASRAIESRRLPETGEIITDRRVGVAQAQMNRLILFVIRVRKIDGRRSVKG